MLKSFHVTAEGPRRCGASHGGCPYALKGEPHFTTEHEAELHFQATMKEKYSELPRRHRRAVRVTMKRGRRVMPPQGLPQKQVQAPSSETATRGLVLESRRRPRPSLPGMRIGGAYARGLDRPKAVPSQGMRSRESLSKASRVALSVVGWDA